MEERSSLLYIFKTAHIVDSIFLLSVNRTIREYLYELLFANWSQRNLIGRPVFMIRRCNLKLYSLGRFSIDFSIVVDMYVAEAMHV